jgi:hypothetical protein
MRVTTNQGDAHLTIAFERWEVVALINALNEVCHGPCIKEWEFHARIGANLEAVKGVLEELSSAHGAVREERR